MASAPSPETHPFAAAGLAAAALTAFAFAQHPPAPGEATDALVPNPALVQSFKDTVPITFLTRGQNRAEWEKLPAFWNEAAETATDPKTGASVERKAVKIKVPLGLNLAPPVPAENPLTVAKWALGKRLYFDNRLSTDGTVACASCHDPRKGYTDQSRFSMGIGGNIGGMNAPTVINSAYHRFQFWDGRAASLEDQSQGPVGNAKEMFGGKGDPWHEAVLRLRGQKDYVQAFQTVFGHAPTRDAAAKAIAAYERTVLVGNSLVDRAEAAMRKRDEEEESNKFVVSAKDYDAALKAAFAAKDKPALGALGLDADKDAGKAGEFAARLQKGHELFFGKARCNLCHVGENLSDNLFHNLGVGVVNGELPKGEVGRYGALPTGHKDHTLYGAHKTPGLRALLGTRPYMHDGSEKTLEDVVELYDRSVNANEFLDPKMRDAEAELAFEKSRAAGTPYKGPEVKLMGPGKVPVAPFKLGLTAQEKADLVLFLKALQGDPVDPVVADPNRFPPPGP